jgi:hypothetical protein
MQQMFLIADLTACSTCFEHHYAHHQELESIIQLVAACGLRCLGFKLSVWCGAEGCVSGLLAAVLVQQPANRTHNPDVQGHLPLQWQPTLDILTGYISSRPMTCTSGCYYSL